MFNLAGVLTNTGMSLACIEGRMSTETHPRNKSDDGGAGWRSNQSQTPVAENTSHIAAMAARGLRMSGPPFSAPVL
jgi:hypothetical protein